MCLYNTYVQQFLNWFRLCVRNLKKSLTDKEFLDLCISAARKGLSRGIVTSDDIDAQLSAQGVPIRQRNTAALMIPELSAKVNATSKLSYLKSIKAKIMLDNTRTKDGVAQSRGYGFVEFLHHGHALACLRELNNSKEYFEFSASHPNQVHHLAAMS